MMDEMPGILNRFLDGLARLRARGDWDIPLDCADAHDEFERNANPASQFVYDCMERDAQSSATTVEVWTTYQQWVGSAASTRGSVHGLSKPELYRRMDALLGPRISGHAGSKRWVGWKLKPIASVEEMDEIDDADDWDD